MHCYFAIQGKHTHAGGWYSIATWATSQILLDSTTIKILKARAGEKNARVVAEITQEGMTAIENGRQVAVRSLSGKA